MFLAGSHRNVRLGFWRDVVAPILLNNGRKSFTLNNAKLVSLDICVAGSSIRCQWVLQGISKTPSPPTFSPPLPSPIAPSPLLTPPAGSGVFDLASAATPQPAALDSTRHKSGSSHLDHTQSVIGYISIWILVLSIVWY